MTREQAALVIEMFERGYSREQIVLALGTPPHLVVEVLRAQPYRPTALLKAVALRQRGCTYNEIQRQCKITDRTAHRWLARAREAGVSLPEDLDGNLSPKRVAEFETVLGAMPSSTTSTASTGTTPTTSPPS